MSPADFAAFVELGLRKSQVAAAAIKLRRPQSLQDLDCLAAARTLEASRCAKSRQELSDLRTIEHKVTLEIRNTNHSKSVAAVPDMPEIIGSSPLERGFCNIFWRGMSSLSQRLCEIMRYIYRRGKQRHTCNFLDLTVIEVYLAMHNASCMHVWSSSRDPTAGRTVQTCLHR